MQISAAVNQQPFATDTPHPFRAGFNLQPFSGCNIKLVPSLQICYNSMRGSEDRNSRIFLRSWSKRVHQARECLSEMLNLLTSVVHPDDLCLWHEFIMIISLKLLDKFMQITSSACFFAPFEYLYIPHFRCI